MVHRGEILMAMGVAGLAVSISLAGFPMFGLLALIICGPTALALLLIGVMMARDGTAPILRQAAGLGLLLLGMVVLPAVALGIDSRPSVLAPGIGNWIRIVAGWAIPAVSVGLGLRYWTAWSARRCIGWGVVAFGFPAAVLVIYRAMMLRLPTTL